MHESKITIDQASAKWTEPAKLTESGQGCVRHSSVRNEGLEVVRGNHVKGLHTSANKAKGKTRFSGTGLVCYLIGIAVILLGCVDYSDQLTCCVGTSQLDESDNDSDCMNIARATSCKIIDGAGPCDVDTCAQEVTCGSGSSNTTGEINPSGNYYCRILYYELVQSDGESQEMNLADDFMISKECVDRDNPEFSDVEVGCEFFRKVFYLDKNTRIAHQKDCYCNKDSCNQDLKQAFKSTEKPCSAQLVQVSSRGDLILALLLLYTYLVQI